jgi:hypothetical protein
VHSEGIHLIPVIKHSSTELLKGESGLNVFCKTNLPPCILGLFILQVLNYSIQGIESLFMVSCLYKCEKTYIDVTSEPVTDLIHFFSYHISVFSYLSIWTVWSNIYLFYENSIHVCQKLHMYECVVSYSFSSHLTWYKAVLHMLIVKLEEDEAPLLYCATW